MSTDTEKHAGRTECPECGLPYYAAENDDCPYCSAAREASGGATSQERTTCETCGLPYYVDEHDECPYCREAAERGAVADETATEPASGDGAEPESASMEGEASTGVEAGSEPTASQSDEEEAEQPPSLVERIRRVFGV